MKGPTAMKSLFAIVIFLVSAIATTQTQAGEEFHFDFGPADAPVMEGFVGISSSDSYSPDIGYGWVSGKTDDWTAPKPEIHRKRWWHMDPHYFYDDMVTDLRFDGVENENPFSLKVDVPKGKYRVVVTAGHLNEARYGMDIYANGKLMVKKVDARHWLSSERGKLHYGPGYYKRVKFSVDVGAEGLEIGFKGDDTLYRKLWEDELAKSPDEWPKSRFKNEPLPEQHRPFYDISGPYTKVSLMGVEVYPYLELPIKMDSEGLKLEGGGWARYPLDKISEAVQAFNAKDFDKAKALFRAMKDPLPKGIGLLAIAGRPDVEGAFDNATLAVEALKEAAGLDGNPCVKEVLRDAEIYLKALDLWKYRGDPARHSAIVQGWRAINDFDQSQSRDFSYWNALTMQGRILVILDPHRWAWQAQEGKRKLRKVEKHFPQNRFVQLHVHNNRHIWPAWILPDYLGKAKGAPDWAAGMYAFYNGQVDFSEWWALNKQQSDGSIGGGWGDDVEVVGFFGYTGRISDGASPLSIECARKLMRGLYDNSGEVDTVGGYYRGVADAEHSAEYTGKTLPMMLAVDYGNPTWNERAMKSAKLMREIWMGVNEKGHLHWRSNYLGASGIGGGGSQLDSAICWRAANPAIAILNFTGNPAIREFVLKHCESLCEDAMRTDKDKPAGLIPGDIDFETDEIGGKDVPTWYDPGDVPYADMFGFEKFHSYRTAIMELGYRLTGDEKYLEPLKAEAEWATKYSEGELGVKGAIYGLEPGTPKWVALSMPGAPDAWEKVQMEKARRDGQDIRTLTTKKVAETTIPDIEVIEENWPLNTTEAQATDRLFVPHPHEFFQYMTGAVGSDRVGHLTYRHVGRDFAGVVLGGDATSLTSALYLFDFDGAKTKTVGLVPWKLELGAQYKAVWGPDADGDDEMDSESGSTDFELAERGQSVDLELNTRVSYVVRIVQTKPSPFEPLLADLAIGPEDLTYQKDWGILHVTVHNIGSAKAGEYEVLVWEVESGNEFRAVGSVLDAPLDFTAKRVRFGWNYQPTEKEHRFEVSVRSLKEQPELTMLNNKLDVTLQFD